jgi:hypothetical protein
MIVRVLKYSLSNGLPELVIAPPDQPPGALARPHSVRKVGLVRTETASRLARAYAPASGGRALNGREQAGRTVRLDLESAAVPTGRSGSAALLIERYRGLAGVPRARTWSRTRCCTARISGAATVGLIEAVDRFERARHPVRAFARPRVRRAVIDEMRLWRGRGRLRQHGPADHDDQDPSSAAPVSLDRLLQSRGARRGPPNPIQPWSASSFGIASTGRSVLSRLASAVWCTTARV